MLAPYFRFRVLNSTDQTLTYDDGARISVKWVPWKFTSGARVDGSAVTQNTDFLNTGESIAAAAESEGAVVDNTTDLNLGLKGIFEVTADLTSTDGTVYLYMEESPLREFPN